MIEANQTVGRIVGTLHSDNNFHHGFSQACLILLDVASIV